MEKIAIYSLKKDELYEEVSEIVRRNGFSLTEENPDIVIALGGDGTLLRAVHHYLNQLDCIKFIGINAGTRGYLMRFSKEDLDNILKNRLFDSEQYSLIECLVKKEAEEETLFAVNEFRFENPFHTMIADVYINNSHLEKFRGNGLVISSSLGSSAYNKSLGGAVVDSSLEVLELTEIAAIENNVYRSLGSSLVLSKDKEISLDVDFKYVIVGYDHESLPLVGVQSILVKLSDKKLNIISNLNKNNIQILKGSFIK